MNMGLTDPRNQEFRVFIYITASALLRGLANLFVDFLTKDPQMTQPFVQAEIPPPGAHIREAGRVLETRLFEGTIVLCHDPARGDEQVRAYDHCSLSLAGSLLTVTSCSL